MLKDKTYNRYFRLICLLMILLLSINLMFISVKKIRAENQNQTSIDVAEKAAIWIISKAIPEAGGYKWPFYDVYNMIFYNPTFSKGVASVGTFLLALYEETGNVTYLDYAKGAAQWIISKAVPEAGGYKWPTSDRWGSNWWLSSQRAGVSGVGEFLLKIYKVTGNSTYLEYSIGAAEWLIANAVWEQGGCFIPYNPPGKYGTQAAHGIMPGREARTVLFLLHLYQETGDEKYLDYVKCTANWLISGPDIRVENGGYKWVHDRPYYVSPKYPLSRMAQIALFFYEVYSVTGNKTYLYYANGTLQWILSQAVIEGDKVKWPVYQGGTTYVFSYPIKDALLTGYLVTHNYTYLEYEKKYTNWVINQSFNGGTTFGAPYYANVYRFLAEMYHLTWSSEYYEYANEALRWIINNATIEDGGYKWKTMRHYPYYGIVWYYGGASLIGYRLLYRLAPIINATIDFKPETLCLKSKGRWVTVFIEFPENYGFNVSQIDIKSIKLSIKGLPGEVSVDSNAPIKLVDHDKDGLKELMVKFKRDQVIELFPKNPEKEYTIIVKGKVQHAIFQGTDTVKIKK